MKAQLSNRGAFALLVLFLAIAPAHANIAWAPVLYPTWVLDFYWVIPLVLILKWPLFRCITGSWKGSILPLLAASLSGYTVGVLSSVFVIFAVSLAFAGTATFLELSARMDIDGVWTSMQQVYWVLYPIILVLTLTLIEFLTLFFFKSKIERNWRTFAFIAVGQIIGVGAIFITAYFMGYFGP